MQRKAEKYKHKFDPHPIYIHRDVHHYLTDLTEPAAPGAPDQTHADMHREYMSKEIEIEQQIAREKQKVRELEYQKKGLKQE